jgi:hypothetical protein
MGDRIQWHFYPYITTTFLQILVLLIGLYCLQKQPVASFANTSEPATTTLVILVLV